MKPIAFGAERYACHANRFAVHYEDRTSQLIKGLALDPFGDMEVRTQPATPHGSPREARGNGRRTD